MRHLDTTLEQLAQQIPGVGEIFNQYQITPCCGGKNTLKEAIANAKLGEDEIQAVIAKITNLTDKIAEAEKKAADPEHGKNFCCGSCGGS